MIRKTAVFVFALFMWPSLALAISPEWTAQKCRLYQRAYDAVSPGVALSDAFKIPHDAFLSSGCTDRRRVCPTTPEEWALADTLTLMIVTEGATGSFLPFRCK
ncbi:MAG: hypothetical protein ACRBCL_01765 [Maritimibacter sp.]